jgi:hypothetical protein
VSGKNTFTVNSFYVFIQKLLRTDLIFSMILTCSLISKEILKLRLKVSWFKFGNVFAGCQANINIPFKEK